MSWRLAHLPWLLTVSGALLATAAVAGGLVRGWPGAAGALAGVAVVIASYLVSTLLIAWADSVNPQLVLPVGLTAYLVKFTLIGFVMSAVVASGWAGLVPMGVGVVVAVVVWSATQIWWVVRHPPSLAYRPPVAALPGPAPGLAHPSGGAQRSGDPS
jgi:hypothetical protein